MEDNWCGGQLETRTCGVCGCVRLWSVFAYAKCYVIMVITLMYIGMGPSLFITRGGFFT